MQDFKKIINAKLNPAFKETIISNHTKFKNQKHPMASFYASLEYPTAISGQQKKQKYYKELLALNTEFETMVNQFIAKHKDFYESNINSVEIDQELAALLNVGEF